MALLGLKFSKLHVSICKIGGYFFSCLCPKVVLRIKIINMKALCKGKHFEKMLSVIISVINDNNWVSEKGSKVNTWPFSIATLGVWPIFHCNILEKPPPPHFSCALSFSTLWAFSSLPFSIFLEARDRPAFLLELSSLPPSSPAHSACRVWLA